MKNTQWAGNMCFLKFEIKCGMANITISLNIFSDIRNCRSNGPFQQFSSSPRIPSGYKFDNRDPGRVPPVPSSGPFFCLEKIFPGRDS